MFPYVYEHPNYVPPPAYSDTEEADHPNVRYCPPANMDMDLDDDNLPSTLQSTSRMAPGQDDELDSDIESHFPITLCNARYLALNDDANNARRPSDESITLTDFMTAI